MSHAVYSYREKSKIEGDFFLTLIAKQLHFQEMYVSFENTKYIPNWFSIVFCIFHFNLFYWHDCKEFLFAMSVG